VPIFSRTPARSTDTGAGAWTWASGSHVWNGTTGTFTAKPRNIARNAPIATVSGGTPNHESSPPAAIARAISGSANELTESPSANTRLMNPRNIRSDAAFVYTKNFIAAYFRRGPPQIPMRKYIGTSTASQKTNHRKKSSAANTPSRLASINSMSP